jgi:uncharacterized protein (TIGR00730 family)
MAVDPTPHRPDSSDEELLEADTPAIISLHDDAERIDRIADELRTGFAALAHVGRAVSIFGSARTTPADHDYQRARELARRLGERGFSIITGGGPGTMAAANEGAHEAGVQSIGLGIELPSEEALNQWVDLPLYYHYFFTRKVMFVRYASAFVVFPGGFGTLDELFEALTLRQTQKIKAFPVILVGCEYWGGMIDWLRERVLAEGKISQFDVDDLEVTDDLERVIELVEAAEHRRPRTDAA